MNSVNICILFSLAVGIEINYNKLIENNDRWQMTNNNGRKYEKAQKAHSEIRELIDNNKSFFPGI